VGTIAQGLFTVGVFQDAEWAGTGLAALTAHGFGPEVVSVVVRESPEATALLEGVFGHDGERRDTRTMGTLRLRGPLAGALDGADEALTRRGLAAVIGRLGFQMHDGHIFEALVARGGVLVAISGDARAADALALLHAYGGGNAAIGAWVGRVPV